jgi:hypothetical protein
MDPNLKEMFIERWERYFPGVGLPVAFFYSATPVPGAAVDPPPGWRCLVAQLAPAFQGRTLCFDVDAIGCEGGKRYTGFRQELRPNFEYFLSCGIPGEMEGERYKRTPELVKQFLEHRPALEAPAPWLVFKRWDTLEAADMPAAVIFWATPDVLSGLFTLANFDEPEPDGVIAPFAAGCGTIIDYPYRELKSGRPRAVLGMFDVSARPMVPAGTLSFAVPWPKFVQMIGHMDESFLITESWGKVRNRIQRA